MNIQHVQHKEHKQNHNCSGVSIAYCKHTRKSLLWVDDASHSLGRMSSWSLTIWAIMTGVIARSGDHTLAKCMKSAIYLELEANSPVDRRGLPAAQIVAFVDEGVRLCGMLGGEDPSFLPLLTSFLNVRSQLRQETADGVVLDANRWRKACGQIDISLQPQDLTMAVLAYTNDQSAWLFARRATFNSENLLRLPPTTWLSTHRFWEWLRYRSSSHWWQGWTNWPLLPSLWQTACQKMSIH